MLVVDVGWNGTAAAVGKPNVEWGWGSAGKKTRRTCTLGIILSLMVFAMNSGLTAIAFVDTNSR